MVIMVFTEMIATREEGVKIIIKKIIIIKIYNR